ncbi:hypothetical protein ACIGDM_01045 [Rothia koreensis]|uniref:hypothetical protein n=1 Tax=Rothia koreensis TaxID=592378 RepID=UPI0037C76220
MSPRGEARMHAIAQVEAEEQAKQEAAEMERAKQRDPALAYFLNYIQRHRKVAA